MDRAALVHGDKVAQKPVQPRRYSIVDELARTLDRAQVEAPTVPPIPTVPLEQTKSRELLLMSRTRADARAVCTYI
jgi:hypothetical protein